jgi:hypothetical protein
MAEALRSEDMSVMEISEQGFASLRGTFAGFNLQVAGKEDV